MRILLILLLLTVPGLAAPCTAPSPWLAPATSPFYSLPAWFLDTHPPVTWVQPADVLYQSKSGDSVPFVAIWLPPVNTRAGSSGRFCMWFLAQGGIPPYTFAGSNLPPGLTVSPAGLYGGMAWKPGTYTNITFCVTDAMGIMACLAPRTQHICDGGITVCSN